MPVLQRSCAACIKAKRRCDLQSPRCIRCQSKNLYCAYTNEPLTRIADSGLNSSASSLSSSASSKRDSGAGVMVVRQNARKQRAYQSLRTGDISTSWPPSVEDGVEESTDRLAEFFDDLSAARNLSPDVFRAQAILHGSPWANKINLPDFPRMMCIDPPSTRYIIATLRSYPLDLDSNNTNAVSILHPVLLRNLPRDSSVGRVFALCSEAANPSLPQLRKTELLDSLRYGVEELVWQVIPEKLATEPLLLATQALILAAITLYLAPEDIAKLGTDSHVWPEEQKRHFHALHHCNRRLWDMAPWDMPDSVDECTKWLMGESIRRTLIIGLVLPDVLLNLSEGGFIYTGFVAIMPFDERMILWDKVDAGGSTTHKTEAERRVISRPRLLSYREMVLQYLSGGMGPELLEAPFVKFLLVCCLGCGAVRMPEYLESPLREEMRYVGGEGGHCVLSPSGIPLNRVEHLSW